MALAGELRRRAGWLLAAASLCVAAVTVAPSAASAAPQAPDASEAAGASGAEMYFARPRVSHVSLSPDGRRVAMSLRTAGRDVIATLDVASRKLEVLARDDDWDLIQPVWVSATRLVYKTWDYRATLSRNNAGAMMAVDVDGTRARRLWDSVAQSNAAGRGPWMPMLVLGPGDAQAQELLVTLADRAPAGAADRFGGSDVYAVNTLSGRRRLLTLDNPGQVQRWVVDAQHRVRAALAMRPDKASGKARYQTWWRADESAPWQRLSEHAMDEAGFYPAAFDADGSLLVVGRHGEDTDGLYRWDMQAARAGELLARHPHADIGPDDLLFGASGRVVGVDVHAMQRERHHFEQAGADAQAAIDRALPGRRNRIQRRGAQALVISSADTDPGSIYLYDVGRARLEPLLRYYPKMSPEALAPKQALRYTARDGLEIPAYLTTPRGAAAKGLPLVVLVHGGPAERDSWGDYWEENEPFVQWLAARGYAVLQPQYRGSTGLGWKLYRAGWKQWSGGSIDDLVDGVQHLVAQGTVDPQRVCTMGKSAGGYSAMFALIKYPQRFGCGVSWAGTTDMALFFSERGTTYDDSAWLHTMARWTHVARDETATMAASSVVRNAQRIRAPVLLAYGSADRTVPLVHGQQLHDALRARGAEVEWTVFEDEGHGWLLEANRIAFATSVVRFLDRHIGPQRSAVAP